MIDGWPSSNHAAPDSARHHEGTLLPWRVPQRSGDTTTDPAELAKFATLGRDWWDATGPMAPLHKLNPVRVAYIRDRACEQFRPRSEPPARRWRG